MASDWVQLSVRDLAEGIFDGPHATPKRTDSGPVFLGISSLSNGRLDLSKSDHLSETEFVKWTRRVTPRADDLVFSYETRLGEAALVPTGLRCCLGRRMALIRPDRAKVDPRFLLYAYLGPLFQETLRQQTVPGSTVDRLLLTEFPGFPILVPRGLDEQRRIAAVLGALDDKIELNRKMNRTLEEMAQAIFKSWFIDFDGHDPADMVDSEFGPIPRGWTWVPFADTGKWISGGTPNKKRDDYWGGDIPWFSAKSLGPTWLHDSEDRVTKIGASAGTRLVPRKSILFIVRGMSLATEWRIGLTAREASFNQDLKAIVDNGVVVPELLLLWLQVNRELIRAQADEAGHGTKRLPTEVLHAHSLALPSRPEQERIATTLSPLLARVEINEDQSRTLAALRDALLPKLISGEIRVPEAEAVASEAL